MKNYRKPINRYFRNYRQLIDIKKWKFWNYRKIIDIEICIKFSPINTWKAKVSEIKFQLIFTKKMQEKLPLLALLPWIEVLILYWHSCTDSYVINFCAILCLFGAILCPVNVFCCPFTLFWALLSRFTICYAFLLQNQKYAPFSGWNYRKPINWYFYNYRQKYRYRFETSSNYRWFEEIIGKVIDIEIDSNIIEKLSLLKKITYRTPVATNADTRKKFKKHFVLY